MLNLAVAHFNFAAIVNALGHFFSVMSGASASG